MGCSGVQAVKDAQSFQAPKSTHSCQALYIWLRHRSLHSAAADWNGKHPWLLKERANLQGRRFLTINFCMWATPSHQKKAKNSLPNVFIKQLPTLCVRETLFVMFTYIAGVAIDFSWNTVITFYSKVLTLHILIIYNIMCLMVHCITYFG